MGRHAASPPIYIIFKESIASDGGLVYKKSEKNTKNCVILSSNYHI